MGVLVRWSRQMGDAQFNGWTPDQPCTHDYSGTRLALTSRSSCTRLSARDAPSDAAAEVTSRYDVTLCSNDVIPCVETFGCAAQSRNSAGVALMLLVVKRFN